MIALDLDGVLCDLGPCVAARIADRFGVATHPSTWRTYDLRLLASSAVIDKGLVCRTDRSQIDDAVLPPAPVLRRLPRAVPDLLHGIDVEDAPVPDW